MPNGGYVIAQGSLCRISSQNPASRIATVPLAKKRVCRCAAAQARAEELFALGAHPSVHPTPSTPSSRWMSIFPKGRLTVVTGVSGSGKTTLVLESLDACARREGKPRRPARPRTAALDGGRHRTGQAHRRDRPSASMSARPLRPTPTSTMNCARYSPERRMPSGSATRRAISPTTPASCAVRCATERAKSVWMFSSCRMWIFPVPSAAARVTAATRKPSATKANRSAAYTLPELMDMDVSEALNACADSEAGKPAPSGFAGSGAWLPDAGRRNAQSFRRRSTAFKAGERNGACAGRFRLCL